MAKTSTQNSKKTEASKSNRSAAGGDRLVAQNRRARFDYDILESVEAGLVLTGTEIKSVRVGRVSLQEAFARIHGHEIWLHGMHIPPYAQGNIYNHEPTRPRKLLLHQEQILDIERQVKSGGLTIVPLRLYITRHRAKVQIAVARGRKNYDKRHATARRDADRDMARALRVRA